jgi:hypothetical protein
MTTQQLAKTLGWRLLAHDEAVFVQQVWGSGAGHTDCNPLRCWALFPSC